jgi:hypothetical protein
MAGVYRIAAYAAREKTKGWAYLMGKTRDRGIDLAISECRLIVSGIMGAIQSFPTIRRVPETVPWPRSLACSVLLQRARPPENAIVGRDQRRSVQKRRGGDKAISGIRMEVDEGGRGICVQPIAVTNK